MHRLPRRLSDFGKLSAGERRVVAGLETGHVTELGPGVPGPDAGEDRRVRASLVRWLALGAPGDPSIRLHEHGLRIMGALIASDGVADPAFWSGSTPGLDLEGCALSHDLFLLACLFEDPPFFRNAHVETLILACSHFPGLNAERLETRGDLLLQEVTAKGEVRLNNSHIGGALACERGQFENPFDEEAETENPDSTGIALNADNLEAERGVVIKAMRAYGAVRLAGARVCGDLDCIGGRFENPGGKALNAQGARVTAAFLWRPDKDERNASVTGVLDLTAAEIGHINDDPGCWPERKGDLLLDRCRYGAFTGRGISAAERIRWLKLQDPSKFGHDFWPQPWEQCAAVLREMGHPEDARAVLIEKERLQRADWRRREGNALTWLGLEIWDRVAGAVIAYGHRPLRAGWFLLALWFFGYVVFAQAWEAGSFKPNNAFILRSAEWVRCGEMADAPPFEIAQPDREGETRTVTGLKTPADRSQRDCFLRQPEGRGFPTFHAGIYAADVLFPLVEIEQQANWVPDEDRAPGAKGLVYFLIVAGWGLSLLAVAGFSGLVKSG